MNKVIGLICALFLSGIGMSQYGMMKYNGQRSISYYLIMRNKFIDIKFKSAGIKTQTEVHSDGDTIVKTYNKEGRIISEISSKSKEYYVYLNDSLLIKETQIYKNKTIEHIYQYDEKYNIIKYLKTKNGKQLNEVSITYDSANRPTEVIEKYGRNLKHTSRLLTFYQGDKKSKTEYYQDGKLIEIFNYQCDPTGTPEINKVKVIEKTLCVDNEIDENGYEVISERVTEQGKIYLAKNFYQITDGKKLLVKVERYDENNRLVNVFYSLGKTGNMSFVLKTNGKINYSYSYFSDGFKSINTNYNRGLIGGFNISSDVKILNKDGLPSEEIHYYDYKNVKSVKFYYEKY
jgi:hypothetical protein